MSARGRSQALRCPSKRGSSTVPFRTMKVSPKRAKNRATSRPIWHYVAQECPLHLVVHSLKGGAARAAARALAARRAGGKRGGVPTPARSSARGLCHVVPRSANCGRLMPPGAAFCPVFSGAFTVRFVTFSVVMGDGTDLNVTAAIGLQLPERRHRVPIGAWGGGSGPP